MALAGVELETLVSEPDALTTRLPLFGYLLTWQASDFKLLSQIIISIAR